MWCLAQHPLLSAALMALSGVTLIFFGKLWPASRSAGEGQREVREQLHQKHVHALAELRLAGLTGDVEVADFGDALGLAVAKPVEAGEVLLTVPESLALDASRAPSCLREELHGGEAQPDCQVERLVAHAVAGRDASRLTGLLALLVMEHRRGQAARLGLEPSAASAVLAVLPEPPWQAENGIFAIDGDEFRVLGTGTSMEGWREAGVNATAEALAFLRGPELTALLGPEVTLEEVRWAYLLLHAHGQWVGEDGLDDGIELPPQVVFLWPLFLARPTPEWQHGVQLLYDSQRRVYEARAPRAMHPGEELLFVDRRLSDASILCFRGLWLGRRHRVRLVLDVSGVPRDPQAQATLQKFGCGAQPLSLYVQATSGVDKHFLSCMRLLALAANATKLQRMERLGWLQAWPETAIASRHVEMVAAGLAIDALQQVLNRLSSSSTEIRQRYGNDPVATRATIRVRGAETMVAAGLLKAMKELQLLSSNEYLFEALRTTVQKKRGSSEKVKGKADM